MLQESTLKKMPEEIRPAAMLLKVSFVDQKKIDAMMVRAGNARVLPAEVLRVYDLEWHGGECPVCGHMWIPVVVENMFARFLYYRPACHCYRRCERGYTASGKIRPGCGRLMVEEKILGISVCTNCGARPQPYPKDSRKKRRGGKEDGEGEGAEGA